MELGPGTGSRNKRRIFEQSYRFDALDVVDFHDLPVIPCTIELLSSSNNTLPMSTLDTNHELVEDYVDAHFRLMREDFLRSLKDGVQSFRSGNMTPQKAHVHHDIAITEIKTKKGDTRKQWIMVLPQNMACTLVEGSGRFLPGHLLLFSTDAFTTIYYGLIQKSSADIWGRNYSTGIFEMNIGFCGDRKSVV